MPSCVKFISTDTEPYEKVCCTRAAVGWRQKHGIDYEALVKSMKKWDQSYIKMHHVIHADGERSLWASLTR